MNKDQLKAAFAKGARIQAWHLLQGATNSNQGQWDTLTPKEGAEPEFGCEAHLYRVHPDDLPLIAELGQEVGAVAVPEGWALVPKQMALTPEALGLIETMCAGPDHEGIGGEGGEDRWCDGILWVGEIEGDNGEKYWGLNIACVDLLEEGSVSVYEFTPPTSPAHTSEARDAARWKWMWENDAELRRYNDGDKIAGYCIFLTSQSGEKTRAGMGATESEAIDAAMRQEGGTDE